MRGRVLHLDYEQGRRITADRYQRMAMHLGIDLASLDGWLECGVLPSVSLTSDMLCRVGENRTLVEVDSWRAAHPSIDENSSEVRRTLDAMGIASEKTGCTFATLSHARKPSKDSEGGAKMSIRGSSGFYDGCQTVYVFDGREVSAPVVSLEKDRIGGVALEPFRLLIEDTMGGAGLSIRAEAIEHKAPDDFAAVSASVCKFIIDNPGIAGVEVLAERMQKRPATVRAVVQSLEAESVVVRTKAVGKGNGVRLYHCDAPQASSSADDAAPF